MRRTRIEWAGETIHWRLDVHFNEVFCRVEDKNVQQNLIIFRKAALNIINSFNAAFQRTMFELLPFKLIDVVHESGIARMGIFQSTDDLYEWLKPQGKNVL